MVVNLLKMSLLLKFVIMMVMIMACSDAADDDYTPENDSSECSDSGDDYTPEDDLDKSTTEDSDVKNSGSELEDEPGQEVKQSNAAECGGKNYHLISPSAHVPTAVNNTIRSAFEFGGQKCSACSRMYVAESLWPSVKEGLVEACKEMKVDSPLDHSAFFSAVINKKGFDKITEYIDNANKSDKVKTVTGGKYDGSKGYFVEPTIYECSDPHDKLMEEEIFGPVVGAYIYPDNKYEEVLSLISETSPYALTGAVFAQDEKVIEQTHNALKDTAGNFYINDKSTGAVVNQQPFGGARLSGTNDKAGSPLYVLRFVSPQSIKQNTQPLESWRYPYME